MNKKRTNVEVLGEVALQVVERYKPDPLERIRVIYNRELRPNQVEWWYLLDDNPDVVCKACPRVGKTYLLAMKNLDELVTNGNENLMVAAPKYDQAVETFRPAYEIIDESEVLQALISRNAAGKMEYGRGFAKFIHKSDAKCFGVTSNFEGYNATILHVDETDDIPPEYWIRLFGRTVAANKSGRPTRKRLSGVIWGKLNLWHFEQDPGFFTLPGVDVYQALASGLLEQKAVKDMRAQMSDEEWLRTMCLYYVEAQNLIWESWLNYSQYIGLSWNLKPVPPMEGLQYHKRGVVSFGLDMGHQGTGDDASDYALQVVEARGRYRRWLWGRTWSPDANPNDIISDVTDYWQFFSPDIGYGDALDANLCAQVNENLFDNGLTYYNWKIKGKNDQEGWKDWEKRGLMTPVHNTGRSKHAMYNSLRKSVFNATRLGHEDDILAPVMIFPQIDRKQSAEEKQLQMALPSWSAMAQLIRELANLVGERLPSGILKIERAQTRQDVSGDKEFGKTIKLGDDNPDALAMANHGLDYLESRKTVSGKMQLEYLPGF
jgi:hypothetical protein